MHPRALPLPPPPLLSIPIVPQLPQQLSYSPQTHPKQPHPWDVPGRLTPQNHATWLSKPPCLWGAIKHSCSGHASKSRLKQQHYLILFSNRHFPGWSFKHFWRFLQSLNRNSSNSQSWVAIQSPALLWNLSCTDVSKLEGLDQHLWAKRCSQLHFI